MSTLESSAIAPGMSETHSAQNDSTGTSVARPNVEWWQKNGGEPWQEEIERRRAAQPRYNRQEAWLTGHFASGPSARVLDFGCGYGRHLKNLHRLGHIDIYGCDMSPTMLASVGEYVNDPPWAREKVSQITPAGVLPFQDHFFDVTYSSEVLIHVHPDDLGRVLAEMARVTFERLVLIENKRVGKTEWGSDAHEGCWLHDFSTVLADLGLKNVKVLEDVLTDQDIYLVDLERGLDTPIGRRYRAQLAARDADLNRVRRDGIREAAAIGAVQLEDVVARSRQLLAEASSRLTMLEREADEAKAREAQRELTRSSLEQQLAAVSNERSWFAGELHRVEHSLARRIVKRAKSFGWPYELVRTLASTAETAIHVPVMGTPKPPKSDS